MRVDNITIRQVVGWIITYIGILAFATPFFIGNEYIFTKSLADIIGMDSYIYTPVWFIGGIALMFIGLHVGDIEVTNNWLKWTITNAYNEASRAAAALAIPPSIWFSIVIKESSSVAWSVTSVRVEFTKSRKMNSTAVFASVSNFYTPRILLVNRWNWRKQSGK